MGWLSIHLTDRLRNPVDPTRERRELDKRVAARENMMNDVGKEGK
jgi:hypothetical protein